MTSPLLHQTQAYPVIVGRYALFDPIASGGMASVHIGRLLGSFGFARTVAIKRLHQNMALDPEFLAMFLDEARLAARIHHTNVVQTLDVVALDNELLLVMEYVSGAALSRIQFRERKAGRLTPHRVAVDIMIGVLNGLHAAHEAKNENGAPLHLVHRDVSPQNVLIGTDGIARLLDFGVAKAVGAVHFTQPNQIKGKLRYLSPESITAQSVTRASDIYAVSVVLWEMLAGRRLFDGENDGDVVHQVLHASLLPPSSARTHISRKLDEIVMCGLSRDPSARFQTAREMAVALESAVTPVNRSAVSEWVASNVGDEIQERDRRVAQIEREVQGEGTGAGQRLQSGRALSAESPVDGRTGGHSIESGSAPSLSIEHTGQASVSGQRRRTWAKGVLAGAALGASLLVAFAWLHFRSAGTVGYPAGPSGATLVTNISTLRPEPIAQETSPKSAGAVASTTVSVASVQSAPAASKPPDPPRSRATTPRKPIVRDRIYRRD